MGAVTEIGDHLVSDPEVYHGEVTFRGTRVPVKTILTFVGLGDSVQDLARRYDLPVEAVKEAVAMSGRSLLETPRQGSAPR